MRTISCCICCAIRCRLAIPIGCLLSSMPWSVSLPERVAVCCPAPAGMSADLADVGELVGEDAPRLGHEDRPSRPTRARRWPRRSGPRPGRPITAEMPASMAGRRRSAASLRNACSSGKPRVTIAPSTATGRQATMSGFVGGCALSCATMAGQAARSCSSSEPLPFEAAGDGARSLTRRTGARRGPEAPRQRPGGRAGRPGRGSAGGSVVADAARSGVALGSGSGLAASVFAACGAGRVGGAGGCRGRLRRGGRRRRGQGGRRFGRVGRRRRPGDAA